MTFPEVDVYNTSKCRLQLWSVNVKSAVAGQWFCRSSRSHDLKSYQQSVTDGTAEEKMGILKC